MIPIPTARPAKAVNPDWYESAVVAGWRIGLNNEVKRVQTLQEVVLGLDAMTQRNPARVNSICRVPLLPSLQIGSRLMSRIAASAPIQ